MSEAVWPIRVGGEYPAHAVNSFRRVTSIDENRIHYDLIYKRDGSLINHFSTTSPIFRMTCSPEDQSPIPALVDALQLASEILHDDPNDDRDTELSRACKAIRAALTKAADCGYTPTVEPTPETTETLETV